MICPQISFLCHFWDVRFLLKIPQKKTTKVPSAFAQQEEQESDGREGGTPSPKNLLR